MKKIFCIMALLLLMVLGFAFSVQAHDINAGPIWSNEDAGKKCPGTCKWYGGWNGQWKTTEPGQMSVCGCEKGPDSSTPTDKNAGPIWNQQDAENKCPGVCRWYGGWNGQWTTVIPGEMSVCGCNSE